VSTLMPCPAGYRRTPDRVCLCVRRYYVKTASMNLHLSGCSFECYREVEVTSCCPGFWGLDCIECPDRADKPCSNRGVCSDGLGGNGTCTCQVGFAGTACEDCAPGRYGPTCSSVCSCVHGLCDSGLTGDGRCTCFSGYKGPNCDQESPECAALTCQQNSHCMQEALTGQLVCQCLPGYQKSGDQCLSINPCLQRVCDVHASCVHTGPNQHLCACKEGYSGDGRVCMAIDPCQTNQGGCSARSTQCVYDGPGKSHCECLPGFDHLLNGSCSMKGLCRPGSCHANAKCTTVGPGRAECTCLQGYIGNGKVCHGNILQRLINLNTEPQGAFSGQLTSLSWPLQNLGPFTVFVPVDKGFRGTSVQTLTTDSSKAKYLCTMHLVAGMMPISTLKETNTFYTLTGKSAEDLQIKIRIHGSRKKGVIIQSDVVASNGIIHIINKLMDSVPPTVENLMKIISDYGKFDKFKSLLQLASVLDRPEPVTVFAPSSAAFDAMKDGHLQYLSSAEGHNKLVELLRNHVVPDTTLEVYNTVSSPRLVTMANQVLEINVTGNGQILVNGAAVLEMAVEAKNGRLYVVDGVLTPLSIEPVLPHRCDVTETRIIQGECVSCLRVQLSRCPSGVYMVRLTLWFFLHFYLDQKLSCCKGFYGPDCSPCPGGYQTACSGHGQVRSITHTLSVTMSAESGSCCQHCSSSNKYGPNCDRTCPCIHGQCDNRPNSDGQCKLDSCEMGFTGRFCEQQTAACGVHGRFCHAHADCDFSQGATRCVCKRGYQGDGITCVESDPCAPPVRGGCSMNAKCVKTGPGTHSCQCLSGWREDRDECQPINKCDLADRGGCHRNATCIYVGPGQASCQLLSSQWTCVCDEGYVGNGHICYGTVAQVRCEHVTLWSCHDSTITTSNIAATNGLIHVIDKVLVPDRKLSEGLLATLALRPEFSLFRSYLIDYNLTAEIEQANGFTVFAPTDSAITAYLETMAATALDVDTTRYHVVATERLLKTDLQSGGYRQTLLGFSFHLGFFPRDGKLFVNDAQINSSNILSGKGVIHSLSAVLQINRNRCDETHGHRATARWIMSSFFLLRKPVSTADGLPCLQVHRCCAGFFGEHCEPCPGPKSQPCFGNGMCLDGTNGTGVCRCTKDFTGTACETCLSGKYGVHCDQDCGCKNGRCSDGLEGDGTCVCDVGWRGVLCDESTTLDAHKLKQSTGFNNLSFPQMSCLCAAGFEGNGTACQGKNPCLLDNGSCSLYAVCKRTRPGQRDCVCNSGYSGDGLVCVEINPCLEGNGGCHANADCVHVGPNKTSCACSEGYTGDGQRCQMINLCRKVSLSRPGLMGPTGQRHLQKKFCP
uniref:Uncharacterized protein n=1 Tax=Monopterus albus TaxID=43700 RepID=A0A3Q3QBM3_MONAL